jgi:alginate O-acetyltransferase complex protein AlgJ
MRRLSDYTMVLGLALLILMGAATGWNALVRTELRLPVLGTRLFGVRTTEAPEISWSSFLSARFSHDVALAIAPSAPFYPIAVRTFNQVQFSLFGLSSNKEIMLGRDGYLLNTDYTRQYCAPKLNEANTTAWAEAIATAQKTIEARGKTFVYLITPSKIAHMPWLLPPGYPCPRPVTAETMQSVLSAFDRAGVHYVDGNRYIDQVHSIWGYEPFPKNGIHYTELAARPEVALLIKAINDLSGARVAVPFDVDVTPALIPSANDQDFGLLLNVLSTPEPNPTALATVRPVTPTIACGKAPRKVVLLVGGSFVGAVGRWLAQSPCPPWVASLDYLTISTTDYNALVKGKPFSGKARPELIDSADVIVLEENAPGLTHTDHVAAFVNQVIKGISLEEESTSAIHRPG